MIQLTIILFFISNIIRNTLLLRSEIYPYDLMCMKMKNYTV